MAKGNSVNLLTAAGAASAIGGAYKFAEFLHHAKKLKDVGPSNAVFVRLIKRIRADLDEVKRLLTVPEIKAALEANPPKAKWVYGVMRDVRGALENITPHTERVGGDIEAGRRIGLRHRLYWLMSEKEKLDNREKELGPAHASLTEVIGFLTPLEPVVTKHQEKTPEPVQDVRHTNVDIDIRRNAPERVDEREVWVERHDHGPRRVVEERETYIERERDPRGERRETWVEHDAAPRPYDERETWVERRGPQHEERYYEDERYYGGQPGPVEEREFQYQRDPRDPRHVEARYRESGRNYTDERRYEERRFDGHAPRRPESFEDRVPERETFMQSEVRRPSSSYRPRSGEHAEYGAPQPSGAAEYRLPPQSREYEREVSAYSKYRGPGSY
ncbi:hypothetical protein M011DRAFT_468683 [Sporormia fimetaria CBS 119925]|uniref:Uncharacterized protein n=1 Tax=Sporormia fimetaria CBS 119925 TaxID=1340428 RepID=A0A6A6V6H3_9PLEO|nr:hypothetical protein M011DRAFT_468683 [Sporormia fimetaria CBS 119925]